MSQPATKPVLLIIAGPAGSGKTTLCERLVADHPEIKRVVTSTTRPPRPGETPGLDYHFFSAGEFDQKVAQNAFLEWAWVHQKNRYGTLLSSVLDPLAAGQSLIINIDVQGVDSFRKAAAQNELLKKSLCTIFIVLGIEDLRTRMKTRGQDSDQEIDRRMQTAVEELKSCSKFDYVIQSSTREADYAALQKIYQSARTT